jgi:hypothetical protein
MCSRSTAQCSGVILSMSLASISAHCISANQQSQCGPLAQQSEEVFVPLRLRITTDAGMKKQFCCFQVPILAAYVKWVYSKLKNIYTFPLNPHIIEWLLSCVLFTVTLICNLYLVFQHCGSHTNARTFIMYMNISSKYIAGNIPNLL